MKTIIYTNQTAYNQQCSERQRKLNLFEEMAKEYHSIIGEVPKDSLLRADSWGYFKNSILATYNTKAPKQLSFEKTISLYELDIRTFKELAKSYNNIKLDETKEVDRDSFCTYATNEKQVEAFNEISSLINSLDTVRSKYNLFRNLEGLCSTLMPLVMYDLGEKPKPSIQFIQSLK